MKVRLLKNVIEGGGVKVARRKPQADGTYTIETPFVKDAVLEMSDASAQKYIDGGFAELYVEETEVPADSAGA